MEPDVQFGIDWSKLPPSKPLHRRLYCCRYNVGDTPLAIHRYEIIKALWKCSEPGDKGTDCDFAWHEWNKKRLRAFSARKWCTWAGPGSCVAGNTRLLDPITGESPTIEWLCENNVSPMVMTLFGPRVASIPYLKGTEELFEVVLKNGAKFMATGGHRVLTLHGYRRVDALSIGDVLGSNYQSPTERVLTCSLSAASHLQTISERNRLTHAPDEHHSRKIAEDFLGNCSPYFCRDDARPRPAEEISRSFSPLPSGAQECMGCVCERLGVRDSILHDTRRHSRQHHPSNAGFSHAYIQDSEILASRHSYEGTRAHAFCAYQPFSPSSTRTSPRYPASEEDRDWQHSEMLLDDGLRTQIKASFGITVSEVAVQSITGTGKRKFYDLHVPGANHYFAEGAIHHNSGKSSDAALFALEWWLESPHESAVIVCSTTKDLLRKRVWAQLAHFHERLYVRFGPQARKRSLFGELIDSETKIRWRKGDDKNCIFGMAVGDGPVEEAINNLIGIHTTRVFLILDEMQGVRPPIVSTKVLGNIAKNPEARFLGMGNPESLNDPLGLHSEPLAGWGSVTLGESQQWDTKGGPFKGDGICLAFDGRRSPADASPEERKRLFWLINKDWVKDHLRSVNGNDQDPGFLSQAVGIWPMSGLESTVLDAATIVKFHCKDTAVWTTRPTACAGFDPSFEGKDQAILQFGKRGITEIDGESRWMLDASDYERITINADSEEPTHYQIVRQVREKCETRKISPRELAIDSTGEGGGLLAIFHREWGPVVGVEFGGRATDMPVSASNPKPAYEEYDRRASELNMAVRTFAINNSLRGLSNEVCQQACARKTEYKAKRYRVETKPDFKKRIGRSPDNLDALAVLVDLCRQNGMSPTAPKPSARREVQEMAKRAAEEFEDGYAVNEYA